jgi:hypothetical protein
MPDSSASLLSSLDAVVGDGVEAAVRAKHRWLALPGLSRRSRRRLGPLVGLVDDG